MFSPWFLNVDPAYNESKGFKTWRTWHSKREILLWTGFLSSTSVLMINAVFVCVLARKHGFGSNRGVISLYEGECAWTKRVNTGAHVCINILSTFLLGASNVCMQLLAAPTRDEVDAAHQRRVWLDIGIPSWKNLRNIKRSRVWVWALLGLSSIPLHFIYNSGISLSIPQYSYAAIVASESFLHGAPIGNRTAFTSNTNSWPLTDVWDNWSAFFDVQANATGNTRFQKLSNEQCIQRYSNIFAIRSSLVVVTEDFPQDKFNGSVHEYIYWPAGIDARMFPNSRFYPCRSEDSYVTRDYNNPHCDDLSVNTPELYRQFKRFNRTVLYCLSERIESRCRINYSPGIFLAVCFFSAIKCACILATILKFKEATISNIGDAIASFLDVPDHTSAHMGAVTKSMFTTKGPTAWAVPTRTKWLPRGGRWYSSPSKTRWAITMLMFLSVIVAALVTACIASVGTQERIPSKTFAWQMKQPIGLPSNDMFTAYELPHFGTSGFFQNVLYANMWQFLVSLIYIAYNALLTCMLVGDEWSRYATQRKTLRVTHPRGIQRSSYFISMPFKYGIPLMICNTILHVLISQSIFIISVTTYLPNFVEDEGSSYIFTGYSTSAAIIAICAGSGTVLLIILLSFIKFEKGMPLASTCSIAISAACHRPAEDVDSSLLPIQWGVVATSADGSVRCSFTTLRTVRAPESGEEIIGQTDFCNIK